MPLSGSSAAEVSRRAGLLRTSKFPVAVSAKWPPVTDAHGRSATEDSDAWTSENKAQGATHVV